MKGGFCFFVARAIGEKESPGGKETKGAVPSAFVVKRKRKKGTPPLVSLSGNGPGCGGRKREKKKKAPFGLVAARKEEEVGGGEKRMLGSRPASIEERMFRR